MNLGTLAQIHRGLANTTWLFMLIMGLWALGHYIRNRPLDGNFFGIVAVGEILLVVQVILGVLMLLLSRLALLPPRPFLHFLYGAFSLLVLPSIYYYTKGAQDRRAMLIWFFTGLFLFGLALRLLTLARFG